MEGRRYWERDYNFLRENDKRKEVLKEIRRKERFKRGKENVCGCKCECVRRKVW